MAEYLSGVAYKQIKDWIISGKLKPGENFSTYNMSKLLNISRSPILVALKQLEFEGLLQIIPQVGCVIKYPDVETAKQHFLMRAILEGLAAEQAAKSVDDRDIQELQSIYEDSKEAASLNDEEEYAKLNKDFHLKIVQMSKMPILQSSIDSFWENFSYYSLSIEFLTQRFEVSLIEHKKILDALKQGDGTKARFLLEIHLRDCFNDFCLSITNSKFLESTLKDDVKMHS